MILDILGDKSLKVDGDVQVDYKTGKIVTYLPETTKRIVLNPDTISAIVISEKKKVI